MGTRYHFDQLEQALFEYFSSLDAAYAVIEDIVNDGSWRADLIRAAERLRHAARRHELLSDSERSDLDRVISEIISRVARGTSQVYVHDENCMSGGWYQSHVTRYAEALWDRTAPLRRLQQCHTIVSQIVRAESLSFELRN